MGLGMACSAARAGFRVVVRDIDPAREALAREAGLTVVPTAAALARNADVLLIVLVDAGQIDDALAGSEGVLAALSPGRLVLVCSTIGPEDSERICARISATGAFAIDMLAEIPEPASAALLLAPALALGLRRRR